MRRGAWAEEAGAEEEAARRLDAALAEVTHESQALQEEIGHRAGHGGAAAAHHDASPGHGGRGHR